MRKLYYPVLWLALFHFFIPSGNAQNDYIVDQTGVFAPVAGSGSQVFLYDDELSGALPIGFTFTFFGNDYTDFHISSNGFITFDDSGIDGCCEGEPIPDNSNGYAPDNFIAFAWGDLSPGYAGETIEYFTTGIAPNRQLVMNFIDVPHCCYYTDLVTTQVILFETTNAIEIHTTTKPDAGQFQTMGIENEDGTIGFPVPGRNGETWSATNDFVRFSLPSDDPDDAGVQSLAQDICAGTQDIIVSIRNFGNNIINNLDVEWEFEGIPQTAVNWTTPLDTLGGMGTSTANVTLGSQTFVLGQSYSLKAWTSMPNGNADPNNINDTLDITIMPALNGSFTIGGLSPDYANFNDAVTAISSFGVCGPVTFNVRNGVYNEQVIIGNIPGASAINTITFQSETGDSSAVSLEFLSTNPGINYTLQLNNADHINFHQLSFKALGNVYGHALHINSQSNFNTFTNNIIQGNQVISPATDLAVIFVSGSGIGNNTFNNNRILNGSFGIMVQEFSWDIAFAPDISVTNNEVTGFWQRGGSFFGLSDLLISGNEFSSPTGNSGGMGVRVWNGEDVTFTKNRIDLPNGGTGVEISEIFEDLFGAFVVNNFIYVAGASGTGMRLSMNDLVQTYYNSIHITSTDLSSTAFFHQNSGIDIGNNIFSNTGGGLAANLILSNLESADYNNYFSTGAFVIKENSVDYTIDAWQSFSGLDANSFDLDPLFGADPDLHDPNAVLNGLGFPIPGIVSDDIDGDLRDALTPDMGADEFTPQALDATVLELVDPSVPFPPGNTDVKVAIRNAGLTTINTFDVGWALNGVFQPLVPYSGSLVSQDTVQVVLGPNNFLPGLSYDITAWVENANMMQPDANPLNDTLVSNNLVPSLAGTYTIGGASPDYTTFNEAVNALTTFGVAGPVTFNVRPATYAELILITPILGANCTNKVTFQSESGNPADVVISATGSPAQNYTLFIDGADGLIFKDITIENLDFVHGRVVVMENGASCNRFENCILRNQINNTHGDAVNIVSSQTLSVGNPSNDDNEFIGNFFEGGSSAISHDGSVGNPASGFIITDNIFSQQARAGIDLSSVSHPHVSGNTINSTMDNVFYGIFMEFCDSTFEITKNQIGILETFQGIFVNNSEVSTIERGLIANNFISIDLDQSVLGAEGLQITNSENIDVFYNSVNIEGISNPTTRAFFTSSTINLTLRNNIFTNFAEGVAVSVEPDDNFDADFNNLYTTGANLGIWNGTNQTDFIAYQAASGHEANSLSAVVFYSDVFDLHTTTVALDGVGTPLTAVTDDIDGQPRDAINPDIGADEFSPPQEDVSLVDITSPVMVFPEGNNPIQVHLVNNGTTDLTSVDLDWSINGLAQPQFNWSGTLGPGGEITNLELGTFDFELETPYDIEVIAINPNGMPDGNMTNDTVSVEDLYAGLIGDYTLGGITPDFPTFGNAVNAMTLGGVAGAVNINIRSGTYNEQVVIPEIPGSSATNWVTFQSEAGDSTLVILEFTSNTTDPYVVRLDGADQFTFREMTIRNLGTTNGLAIEIQNQSDNITIANNILTGIAPTNDFSNQSVIRSQIGPNTNTIIRNNKIENGSNGIQLLGTSFNNQTGTVIENNELIGQIFAGIELAYNDAAFISGNIITTGTASQTVVGIDLVNCDLGVQVIGNQIISNVYGLRLQFCNGLTNDQGLIANNFIAVGELNAVNARGIWIQNSDDQNIYYNSVRSLKTTAGTNICFHVENGANDIYLLNNIFANTGTGIAIDDEDGDQIIQSDHNNLFSNGDNLTSFNGQVQINLAQWQAVSGFDANSISVDPNFVSNSDLHIQNGLLVGQAMPIPEIPADIDGDIRDGLTPDIGADEYTPVIGLDAGISGIIDPSVIFPEGLNNVVVRLFNYGSITLNSVTINWDVNSSLQTPFAWSGTLNPGEFVDVTLGTYEFEAGINYTITASTSGPNAGTDLNSTNNQVVETEIWAGLSGIYTISSGIPDFLSIEAALTALAKGGVTGPVIFNIGSATYTLSDGMMINPVLGSSLTNTVTWQSETGDSTDVVIEFSSTAIQSIPVLTLNATKFMHFKNLSLSSTSTEYGVVVSMLDGTKEVSFENCVLESLPTTINSQTTRAIMVKSNARADNVTITNNHFKGGTHGMYYWGTFSNASLIDTGLVVTGNLFEDHYVSGAEIRLQSGIQFNNNTYTSSNTHSTAIGFEFNNLRNYFDHGLSISGNQVDMNGGQHAMTLEQVNGSTNVEALISNNFLHISDGNRAVEIIGGTRQKFYHNNVHMSGSSNLASRAMYVGNVSSGIINIVNNNFVNSADGFALYTNFLGIPSSGIFDYNNYFSSGATLMAYQDAGTDFAGWQGTSGFDANGLNLDPLYTSDSDLHVSQIGIDSMGTPLPEVGFDFDGQPRNPTHPDIGADEFGDFVADVGITALIAPVSGCDLSADEDVTVTITNFSGESQTGFDVAYTIDGNGEVIENVGALNIPAGGSLDYTFTAKANLIAYADYTFEAYTLLAGDAVTGNDTLSNQVVTNGMALGGAPTNMIPADGTTDLELPVNFSWAPVANATSYDVYVWEAGNSQPGTATYPGLTVINFDEFSLAYGTQYQWVVHAVNACEEIPGPVQTFTIIERPDLIISNLNFPATAFSGEEVQVSFQVDNIDEGATGMTTWGDRVYLSADDEYQPGLDDSFGSSLNVTALNGFESYLQMVTLTIPQGFIGTFYLIVRTDDGGYVNESDEDNNLLISATQITINLTPPPDLQVTSVLTPATAFSGMDISVNWTVENNGTGATESNTWIDKVYISSDENFILGNATELGSFIHSGGLLSMENYAENQTLTLPLGIDGTYYIYVSTDANMNIYEHVFDQNNVTRNDSINIILTPPTDLAIINSNLPATASTKESITVDWVVENQGGSPPNNPSWNDRIYISDNPVFGAGDMQIRATAFQSPILNPTDTYNELIQFSLPDDIAGNYYLHLSVDDDNSVFEFTFEDNNIVTQPITINAPDLAVFVVNAPIGVTSGEPFLIDWDVENIGLGDKVFEAWSDGIYISTNPVFNISNSTFLSSKVTGNEIESGNTLNVQQSITIPDGFSGNYWLHLVCDQFNSIFEDGSEANNIKSIPISVTLGPAADLAVSEVIVPDTATAGFQFPIPISFSITNDGADDAEGSNWVDQVYLTDSPVWPGVGNAILLKSFTREQPLMPLDTYSISTEVILPPLPPGVDVNICYIYIATDLTDNIFENGMNANNILRGDSIFVNYPIPDLAVTDLFGPTTAFTGEDIQLDWTVENLANDSILFNYDYWYDGIFISDDAIWDASDEFIIDLQIYLSDWPNTNTYSTSRSVTLPENIDGNKFLLLVTDYSIFNEDDPDMQNNVMAHPINIQLTPPRDLQVTALTVPPTATSGQPFQVIWTVQNTGSGPTLSGNWIDRIYLSDDLFVDSEDEILGSVAFSGNLMPGESYTDTTAVFTSAGATGNYVLLLKTDANSVEYEHMAEDNNVANGTLALTQPPPSDLVVGDITVPVMGLVNSPVTIDWDVQNEGLNPASGIKSDAIYFSTDTVWDINDVLFEVQGNMVSLPVGGTQSYTFTGNLPGLPLGDYHVITRTDVLNNIFEANETNNTSASIGKMTVDVPELPLEVWVPNTLNNDVGLYYRLEIPDSLSGETLLVELEADSLFGANELYMSYEEIPTRSDFDFNQDDLIMGDQTLIVPALQSGTYYLLIYGQTPIADDQAIEVRARRLDFEVFSVNANEGGNTGQITVLVKGAKFSFGMFGKIEDPVLGTIFSSNVIFIDPSKAFVTFDLNGSEAGIYDIFMVKPDGAQAGIDDGFTIVEGADFTLLVDIQHPPNARFNRTVAVTIAYTNAGNVDIPSPNRFLKSLVGAALAFDPDLLFLNLQDLHLEFEEPNGPPDILRPGAVSAITVYTKARAPDDRLRFKILN
ncbi:MAG: CARDB domain-containing protein [Bacteroidota bacterium]